MKRVIGAWLLALGCLCSPADAAYNPALIPLVPSLSALATVNYTANQSVRVSGAGTYIWNAGSTATADGYFVIAVSGIATGRWLLDQPIAGTTSLTTGTLSTDTRTMTVTPGAESGGVYGVYRGIATYNSTFQSDIGLSQLTGVYGESDVTNTGTVNQVQGVYGVVNFSGNGGSYPVSHNSGYALRGQCNVLGSTVVIHCLGEKIEGPIVSSTASVNQTDGLYIQDMTANVAGGATVTNSHAIVIEGANIQNSIGFSAGDGSTVHSHIFSPSQGVITMNVPTNLNVVGRQINSLNDTLTSGTNLYINDAVTINPGGASTATTYATRSVANYASTSNSSGTVYALDGESQVTSTGTAATYYGVQGLALSSTNGSAYTANLVGGLFQVQINGTSSVTAATGITILGPNKSGNINTATGIRIGDMGGGSGGGTITTSYAENILGAGLANSIAWNGGGGSAAALLYSDTPGHLIFHSSGGVQIDNAALTSQGAVMTAAAPTVAAAQVGIGSTTAAVANCGSAATACLVVNVAGTTRYVPYY